MLNEYIKVEMNIGTALLTIDSQKTLNALNNAVISELESVLHKLNDDNDVKVVVLTGAGEKAFVAGADIKEMLNMSTNEAYQFSLKGQRVMLFIEQMTKPVIAAVNGYALGGGLELALACDFIYASEKAKFGFPEVTLGIMPGFGGAQSLARKIGIAKANEIIFSGITLDSAKAYAWGIVNDVFPQDELLPRAYVTASAIASVGTLGVSYVKNATVNGLNMSKEDGFKYEATLFGLLFATEDQKEGMNAFIQKRKAKFKGR